MSLARQTVEAILLKRVQFVFLTLLLPLIFGCSNKKSILFRTNGGQAVKSTLVDSAMNANERYSPLIQVGDNLTITNLTNENLINGLGASTPLQIKYEVDENGKIKLPGIGEIRIVGLEVKEAEELITKAYKANMLADPLFVITILNAKVTLLGEFSKQGNFPLESNNTTLINVLGEAGGFNPRADQTSLKIIRGDKTNPEVIEVDLTNIASLASPKLRLRNGDIIYSEPRNIYLFSDKISPILSYVGIGTSLISLILLFSRR